ncbi:hypothetical protein EOL96_00800 [Candidatus Saccharibacteria bacterium]|nr:hypothetical protein [Candidatus Saccharibacteria bacterium]
MARVASSTRGDQQGTRRRIGVSVVGVGLLAFAGYVAYLGITARSQQVTSDSVYSYNITQQHAVAVGYVDNSFFDGRPGSDNTAYITDLTDTVNATFRYTYQANRAEQLTYTNTVNAVVRGTYSLRGSDEDSSNVWTKNMCL